MLLSRALSSVDAKSDNFCSGYRLLILFTHLLAFNSITYCDVIDQYLIFLLHTLVNLAHLVNGTTRHFSGALGEPSEQWF